MYKKIKVAAYCRVSTDTYDQMNSLSTQRTYFNEYIDLIIFVFIVVTILQVLSKIIDYIYYKILMIIHYLLFPHR